MGLDGYIPDTRFVYQSSEALLLRFAGASRENTEHRCRGAHRSTHAESHRQQEYARKVDTAVQKGPGHWMCTFRLLGREERAKREEARTREGHLLRDP